MDRILKVLLVEDCEADAMLLERELRRGGFVPECTRVEDAASLRRALADPAWDIIITDYALPHFDGLAAFKLFQETTLDIPFIIVSGTIGEELAVEAMKSGIQDYVMKDNLVRLVPAIQRELREADDRRARRLAEERLRMNERLRTVGELTASLIHDLKNPLQSILLSTELMNDDDLKSEQRLRLCQTIERQVQRVLLMSEEVLDFVRGTVRLTLEPVALDALVQEVVDIYSAPFAANGIQLSRMANLPEAPNMVITCDREKIWRALQNLINNAKDAISLPGHITLRVGARQGKMIIEVTDTGDGIPEGIRENLFEPFVTGGKKNGTGLGLAIVKSIVDAHGGMITFETATGVGTTFFIELPERPPARPNHAGEVSVAMSDDGVQVYEQSLIR